jgi:ketosteroid isomerase-like protein
MAQSQSGGLTGELSRRAWDRFGAAWERGDMSGIDEVFSADLIYHVAPFPDLDRQGLKDFVGAFRQGFHDFGLHLDEELTDEARSLHRWHCEGVFGGATPLLPVEPTGRRTAASGTLLLHWRQGEVVEAWHSGDWLGWLTGAGVLPPLGQ